MKLLFENWKRFLKEADDQEYDYDAEMLAQQQELEKEHFGSSIKELAQMAYDTYREQIKKYSSQVQSKRELILYHEAMASEVYHKSGKKLLDGGRGSFRATFHYDKDYVIKIDATLDVSGRQMNQEEKELGTTVTDGELFPRCFLWSPTYEWIVVENVKEIRSFEEINDFFPNNLIKVSDPVHYHMYFMDAINYRVAQLTNDTKTIERLTEEFQQTKHMFTVNSYVTIQKIQQEFRKNNLFNNICRLIVNYDLDTKDSLSRYNTGIGFDGRFVILDPSVKETLFKGIEFARKKL
jgi:hypothetical protein